MLEKDYFYKAIKMDDLKNSVLMALERLSGPGMFKDNKPVGKVGKAVGHSCWNGAIRGEYLPSEKG